jgi:hypothetical protein
MTIVMAIFGVVTGFSTSRAARGLPLSIGRDPRLVGVATGSVMLLVIVACLATVWSLMRVDIRQWALSYVLAYAAGILAASFRRSEKVSASTTSAPDPAWRHIRTVPRLLVAVLLLAGPLYFVVTAWSSEGGPLVALLCMAVVLVLTIWLQRLRCPVCNRRFFGPGAYWADRCASCRSRCPIAER